MRIRMPNKCSTVSAIMRIAGVVGILTVYVSSSTAQFENFHGIDTQSIYNNVETIENAFGKTLGKKLIDEVNAGIAGTFTPQRALEFLEKLTAEEKDKAAEGIITLVQELEKILSAPGTSEQLRMAFELAPMVLRQLIPSTPEQKTSKEPSVLKNELKDTDPEGKNVIEVIGQSNPNETAGNVLEDEDMSTDEIRKLIGDLTGTGKMPDELLEIMEELLNAAEEYEDSPEERMVLDDKSTSTLTQIKNTAVNVDEIAKAAEGERIKEVDIKEDNEEEEEKSTNEGNINQHESRDEL